MKALKIGQSNQVYCYDPRTRKYVKMGTKIGDIFIKSVQSKHFMRKVNGYGLQYDAFSQFQKAGIERVRITEVDTGNAWISDRNDWIAHGKVADYGHGKQVFLSLKYMHLEKAEDKEKARQERERKVAEVKQRSLFNS